MSTHVDGAAPSVAPDPADGDPRPGTPSPADDTGSEWVRAEMQRRMAANRSNRGRHARRAAAPRDGDDNPTGPVTMVRAGGRRRPDAPPPWVAAPPSAADLPENYVPRHSVQTPGPAAEPSPSISGPIPVVRPAAGAAFTDGTDRTPAPAPGPIGGPSLPASGLPMRRRRGSGPGTPLQAQGTPPVGPPTGPWMRPSPTPRPVVPHEAARRLGAPPRTLGGPEPIPAWGLPLATPARGLATPGGPASVPGRGGEAGGAVRTGPAAAPAPEGAVPDDGTVAPSSTTGPAVDGVPGDGVPRDGVPGAEDPGVDDPAVEDPTGETDPDATGAGAARGVRIGVDRPAPEVPAVNGSAVNGSALNGSTARAGTVDGAAAEGAEVDGSAVEGAVVDGAVVDGAAVDGGPVNGSAAHGAAVDGAAAEGPAVDGAAVDGAAVDGAGRAGADGVPANGRAVLGPAPGPAGRTGGHAVPGREVVDPPTAPQPVVVGHRGGPGRIATTGGHAVAVPVQRTPESARALAPRPATPRAMPVVGTAPEPGSTRVRVVLSERKGIARTVRTIKEVQEGTAVGVMLRRDLIRSQLRVTLRFALSMVLVLGALPAVFAFFPQVGEFAVLGVRLPWIMLGVLVYPFLFLVAWHYARLADRVEQNFADHVQDR